MKLLAPSNTVNITHLATQFIYHGCIIIIVVIMIFKAHQHKAAGMKIKLIKNNDHNGVSHGVKCSREGLLLLLLFKPTSTKPQAEILTLNKVNGCNDVSFGDHSVLEGDRIPR